MKERGFIDLFGVPLDLGGNRRGTDMGPSAVRIAGINAALERLGYAVVDHGDIEIPSRERIETGARDARYLEAITATCEQVRVAVAESLGQNRFPLVIGGDHSIAMGTIAGAAGHARRQDDSIGVVWIDAHADMNTPASSPSGNIHGMPLSVVLGLGDAALTGLGGFSPKVKPHNVALIGIRDLDAREREIVAESKVTVFTMKEIDTLGMSEVARRALTAVTQETHGVHVSLDLDGIDPVVAPGVGTPVRGGLTFRETHLLMELLADSNTMISMEVVELNPILDDRNATAGLAVGIVESALGRKIL